MNWYSVAWEYVCISVVAWNLSLDPSKSMFQYSLDPEINRLEGFSSSQHSMYLYHRRSIKPRSNTSKSHGLLNKRSLSTLFSHYPSSLQARYQAQYTSLFPISKDKPPQTPNPKNRHTWIPSTSSNISPPLTTPLFPLNSKNPSTPSSHHPSSSQTNFQYPRHSQLSKPPPQTKRRASENSQ